MTFTNRETRSMCPGGTGPGPLIRPCGLRHTGPCEFAYQEEVAGVQQESAPESAANPSDVKGPKCAWCDKSGDTFLVTEGYAKGAYLHKDPSSCYNQVKE